MSANTNEILWQDQFDRQSGRGKYASANNLRGGNPLDQLGQMSEWGNPQTTPLMSQGPTSFRMPATEWSPGEFDAWKTAKMTGMPTQYGKIMQDRYERGRNRILPAPGQIQREDAALAEQYPNSAFEMLRRGNY